MKRVLIVGASSFIGSNLCVALRAKYRVFGTYSKHKVKVDDAASFHLEIAPHSEMQALVAFLKPDILIYCAGVRDEAQCRKDPMGSLFVNTEAPGIMAAALRPWGGRLIYFSSSKVFSGHRGGYLEEDTPQPASSYGTSKMEAEAVLASYSNVFILRLGTIYGIGALGQDSMFNRILSALWSGAPTSLISDEYRSFVAVEDLIRFVEKVLEASNEDEGIYHVGTSVKETYYDFALATAKVFGFSPNALTPVSGRLYAGHGFNPEERGGDLSLDSSQFASRFDVSAHSLEFSLRRIQQKLRRGQQ